MEGLYQAYVKFDCYGELQRRLGHQIEIFYGTQPVTNDDSGNSSLSHLPPGDAATHWNRPLLARGIDHQTGEPVGLDTNAVPAVLDFLAWNHTLYPEKTYAQDTVMDDDAPVQK